MPALSQEQKNAIAQRLRQRERELYADIRREQDKRGEYDYRQLSSEAPDPGDEATADLITDLEEAEVGRDLKELRAIGESLRRIQGEDYGDCLDCGVEIPYERLQAEPTALRCTRCQTLYEKNHAGQQRGPTL